MNLPADIVILLCIASFLGGYLLKILEGRL